jgi:chromatin segregation and condensation protein Rec8/ScpA/Scc1 (kleisin family)
MNFGLALASQRIPGVTFNLLALNNNHEPESAEAALYTYGRIFIPERNLEQTIKRLTPLLNDPDLQQKVEAAAGKTEMAKKTEMNNMEETTMAEAPVAKMKVIPASQTSKYMLPQVAGIIIGSPEFQRK